MSSHNEHVEDLIRTHLMLAVPFAIERFQKRGGPTEDDLAQARSHSSFLGSKGEALYFHMKGETARAMDLVVEAIAILAFVPGGIESFGLKFEVKDEQPREPSARDELIAALESFKFAVDRLEQEEIEEKC